MISWVLQSLDVPDVPGCLQIKHMVKSIQHACSITTRRYEGALGHIYYMNDLSEMIAREMANPFIRPHLHFFPEDSGQYLSHAYQGQCWLSDLDATLLTPMIHQAGQDFYIFEPCLTTNGSCCVPVRFFKKGEQIFARVWHMYTVKDSSRHDSFGWVVVTYNESIVPATSLLVSFSFLATTYLE